MLAARTRGAGILNQAAAECRTTAADLPAWLHAEIAFSWAARRCAQARRAAGVESPARMPKGVFIYTNDERDVRILEGMAAGLDNAEIARAMGLSHGTVRVYVSQLFERLGAKSRSHAVMRGIAEGLIAAPTPAAATARPRARRRQLQIDGTNGRRRK